jgi:hypothetical protein
MKTNYKLLSALIIILSMLMSCSDTPTGNDNDTPDTVDPTVSFENIADGADVSGIFSVTVNATDNEEIDLVAIYMDGQKIDEIDLSRFQTRFQFSIDCNDYTDGAHTLQAKAWDAAGNIGITNIITINTMFDFAPHSNGKIEVSITHYQELDPVDTFGYGDPYFIYILDIDNVEFDVYTSPVYLNVTELNITISHVFDIPDNTREYKLTVLVRDDDTAGYDELDYTHLSGTAYVWTMEPITNDFMNTYSGEDDGSSGYDDNDCEITLEVETTGW